MDARGLHGGNRLDGASEFALETALIVDLLGELADAELLAFHQFEAHRAAARQPLPSQAQADIMHAAGGNEDGATGVVEPERNVHLFQRSDDRAAVAFADVREQDAELALSQQGGRRNEQSDHRRDGDHQHHFLLVAQACERLASAR